MVLLILEAASFGMNDFRFGDEPLALKPRSIVNFLVPTRLFITSQSSLVFVLAESRNPDIPVVIFISISLTRL